MGLRVWGERGLKFRTDRRFSTPYLFNGDENRVWGVGCTVSGVGRRVQGAGCRVWRRDPSLYSDDPLVACAM